MRALFIGSILCMTAGTFLGAERLISSRANSGAIEQKAMTQTALDIQLKQSKASFAVEIAALEGALSSASAQVNTLTSTTQILTNERDAALSKYAEIFKQARMQQAMISEKDLQIDGLQARVGELVTNASALAVGAAEDNQLAAKVAALSDTLKARDATIASLEATQSEAGTAELQKIDASAREELAVAQARIVELIAATAEQSKVANDQIDLLTKALGARDATIDGLQAELGETLAAKETTEAPITREQVKKLGAEINELTQIIADQTDVIATLRLGFGEKAMPAMEMAAMCGARAKAILEGTQIKFGTGTSAISGDSVVTLDNLRDLAIGCDSDEMVIKIGGHTDSFGAESDNQRLSEARANSVKEFLVGRGIPEESMLTVGFGEKQPIATNATKAGRAENRRITFTWEMRENVSISVDG